MNELRLLGRGTMTASCIRCEDRILAQLPFTIRFGGDMRVREFTDSAGLHWLVWATMPSSPHLVSPELHDGWLTFDSGSSRRRLAPIPQNWDQLSAERLHLLCQVATSARTSDPFRDANRGAEDQSLETQRPQKGDADRGDDPDGGRSSARL
jgi:hypothetical protein